MEGLLSAGSPHMKYSTNFRIQWVFLPRSCLASVIVLKNLEQLLASICITVKQQMKFVPGPVIWGGGVGFYLQSCYVSLLD